MQVFIFKRNSVKKTIYKKQHKKEMTKSQMHGSLLRVLSGCGGQDSNLRPPPYEGGELPLLYPAISMGSVFRSDPTTAPKWKETKIIEVIGKADNYITRSCFEPLLRGTSSLAIRHWCILTDASGAWGRNWTADTRIFSPLLYLLSYPGIWRIKGCFWEHHMFLQTFSFL